MKRNWSLVCIISIDRLHTNIDCEIALQLSLLHSMDSENLTVVKTIFDNMLENLHYLYVLP